MKKTAFKLMVLTFVTGLVIMGLILLFLTVIGKDWLFPVAGSDIPSFELYDYFSSKLVNSELVYFLLCFAILLPLSLVLLMIAIIPLTRPLYHRRKLQKMVQAAQRKLARHARKLAREAKKESRKARKLHKTRFPQLKRIDAEQKAGKAVSYDSATLEEI
ncbi:MAG: hypothetical protein J6R82_04550 [Clostridia bacterium]|nr:hypothetical protein [Clostridia bacterium]